MNVRQANSADAPLLSSLSVDVQRLHAEHHPDVFKVPSGENYAVTFFSEALADVATRIYIAEQNGDALGYVLCKLIERQENPFTVAMRYLLIDQISVRPSARRQGVGAALMEQAKLLARTLGVQKMQLDSWGFNLNAHAFFERIGFQKFDFRFWRYL